LGVNHEQPILMISFVFERLLHERIEDNEKKEVFSMEKMTEARGTMTGKPKSRNR